MFNNYYKDKTVLITGHTGFKGSWLKLWLEHLGAKVFGYSLYLPSTPSLYKVLFDDFYIPKDIDDVRNYSVLYNKISYIKPDIIFHLAAQPIVSKSYRNPLETLNTNINGAVNLLECIRKYNSPVSVVIITSDKVYKNQESDLGYKEEDELGGDDPYSASKACMELIVNSYYKSFFKNTDIRITTTRAGNVIGGGDWAKDRLIPDCIRSWRENKPINIRMPFAIRPWQHVLEPLSGYLWLGYLLSEREFLSGNSFNFGPLEKNFETVAEVIKELSNHLEIPKYTSYSNNDIIETNILKLDCTKSFIILDWEPILSFKETVEKTAKWYQCYYNNINNIKSYSLNDISEYEHRAKERGLK